MVNVMGLFLQPAFTFPPILLVPRASTSRNPAASGTDTALGRREPPLTFSCWWSSRLECYGSLARKNLPYFLDPPTSAIQRVRRSHRKLAATQNPALPMRLLLSKATHNLLEDTYRSGSRSREAVLWVQGWNNPVGSGMLSCHLQTASKN